MSNTCFDCSRNITGNRFRGVQCTGKAGACKKFFHLKCITPTGNIDESLDNGTLVWTCKSCKSTNHTTINVGTDSVTKSSNATTGNSGATIDDVQLSIINLSKRFGGLESAQQFMTSSVDALRKDLLDALDEIKDLRNHIKKAEDECVLLRKKVNHLESLHDIPFQQKLINNIVISGVPTNNCDNRELVMKVLAHVYSEIVNAEVLEINKIKADATEAANSTDLFIVKLASIDLKTTILRRMKNFKHLTTDKLGIQFNTNSPRKIFIMEHFTAFQSKLYKEAKLLKQEHNFRFLWVKNGVIMLRHDSSSQVFYLRSFNNLQQIKDSLY